MLRAWEEEYKTSLPPSIHFTGGEPFLYRRICDAIAHARQCGFKVVIMTNGCLITAEDAQNATAFGIADIQISLEGLLRIHDDIHSARSYAQTLKGARLLIDAGNCVCANMTLSRLNIKSIEETAEIAKNIGFSRLVPCGSGESLLDGLLTPNEIKKT